MRQGTIASGEQTFPLRKLKAGSLAWVFAFVSILGAILALGIAAHQALLSGNYRTLITHQTLTPFITAGFAVIGALIAARRPRNPIGWIFVAVGFLFALTALAAALSRYGSPASPVYPWALWIDLWLWIPAVLLPVTFVLLVFPDGHLPSPGWRFTGWAAALGLALTVLVVMLHPGPVWGQPTNPFGIPGAAPVLDKLSLFGSVFLALGFLGSLAAFGTRFRRSAGIERAQMKWLVYAVGIFLFVSALSSLLWFIWPDFPWAAEINIVLTDLGVLGIAVAAAIAVLRHRLYDIDLIINRSLVYSALMVGVAALYGLVVGASLLRGPCLKRRVISSFHCWPPDWQPSWSSHCATGCSAWSTA